MKLCVLDPSESLESFSNYRFYQDLTPYCKVLIVLQQPWMKSSKAKETPIQVKPNLWVVYRKPLAATPFIAFSDQIAKLDSKLLARQLENYCQQLGWTPNLVETAYPHFHHHLIQSKLWKRVFWIRDQLSRKPGQNGYLAGLAGLAEHKSVQYADLSIVTTSGLKQLFSKDSTAIVRLPMTANAEVFQPLWMKEVAQPESMKRLKRPLFGYVGDVNEHCDWKLLSVFARHHPQFHFALIGAMNGHKEYFQKGLIAETLRLPNVHFLGQAGRSELPAMIAHFDVGFFFDPINEEAATRNREAMYQFLLAGLPVTGSFSQPDHTPFRSLLHQFSDPHNFPKYAFDAYSARDQDSSKRRREYAESIASEQIVKLRLKIYEALLSGKPAPDCHFPAAKGQSK